MSYSKCELNVCVRLHCVASESLLRPHVNYAPKLHSLRSKWAQIRVNDINSALYPSPKRKHCALITTFPF